MPGGITRRDFLPSNNGNPLSQQPADGVTAGYHSIRDQIDARCQTKRRDKIIKIVHSLQEIVLGVPDIVIPQENGDAGMMAVIEGLPLVIHGLKVCTRR